MERFSYYFFVAFAATAIIITTTNTTRNIPKPIPALNIPAIALQELKIKANKIIRTVG